MTRWLHRETVTDQSQGAELPMIHPVVPNCGMPQIMTKMNDGVTVHDGVRSSPTIRRIHPALTPSRIFDGHDIQGELFIFGNLDVAEMEFALTSHLIILLPDGISGVCEWSDGDRSNKFWSATRGRIIFNPAQEYLRIRMRKTKKQCRVLLLTIGPMVLSRLNDDGHHITNGTLGRQIAVDDRTLSQALAAIQHEIDSPGANSRFYVETFLMLALNRLIQCSSNVTSPQQQLSSKGGLPNWRLKRALKLLEGDLSKTPSLSEVAESIHLHPTSFCRAFKQSTGLSPHRYLLVHRIECAKEMMNDHNRTLTQIALDCGFSSSSQFSVVFRRIMGVSPRKYRRSL
jgi:AraC-like DNA-binding protein